MRPARWTPLLATLALAAPAAAAVPTYTQYICRLPGGEIAPTDGITVMYNGGSPALSGDFCASGGSLVLGLSPTSGAASPTLHYSPAQNAPVAGFVVDRSVTDLSGRMSYSIPETSDKCFASEGCQLKVGPFSYAGPVNPIDIRLECPSPGCAGSGPDGQVVVTSMEVDLEDDFAPTFTSPPAGGLFSTDRPVSGTEAVAFSAADKGGGVYEAAVVVDGVEVMRRVVDNKGGDCAKPFTKRTPCKLNVDASLPFDTTQLANGAHDVTLVVYDVTSTAQNSVSYGPVRVDVENTASSPGSPDGSGGPAAQPPASPARENAGGGSSPVKGSEAVVSAPNGAGATPQARLVPARTTDRRIRLPYGQQRVLVGRLVDDGGRPIAGAKLAVYATPLTPGASPVLVGTPVTGPDGSYRVPVRADGPSRQILVAYRPGSDDPAFTTRWTSTVEVPAPISLTPSRTHLRNKQTLRLSASVPGEIQPRSADVAFQVLIGSQWRTFAVRAVDGHGRASVAHKFRVTYQRLRYRFRALAIPRRTFPYARGVSKPVGVLVN